MSADAQKQKVVIGYLPNYNDIASQINAIDYSKLTHIDVAFENPTNDTGDFSFNEAETALIEKAHQNHVKVLVSIAGGGASQDKDLSARYFDLQSDAKRAAFVQKLADYVVQHNFDGLDVDLEGPGIGKDYGAFVADLSKLLHRKGKLLTAAVSQFYGGDNIPDSALKQLDFVNIMAYDFTGPWEPNKPGQHSSLDASKKTVAYWLGRGVPKSKAVLGVPFYGYGFGNASRGANGDYSYSELVTTFPGCEKLDQVGDTIWYNGIPTIKAKTKYVRDEGLAGVMIWSIDKDAPGSKSLLTAISEALHS